MRNYALCNLEILALIERALLPDVCVCTCKGDLLTVTLTKQNQPGAYVSVENISMQSLQSSRAIANLVGELRYLMSVVKKPGGQSLERRFQRQSSS